MKIPLQISTRKLSLSDAAINSIKSKAYKLEKFYNKIIACRVMVETPHRHKNHGIHYNVSIDISVPGGDVVVKKEHHEDVYVAIRDAFDSARRQLLHYSRKRNEKQNKMLSDFVQSSIESEIERIVEQDKKHPTYEYVFRHNEHAISI